MIRILATSLALAIAVTAAAQGEPTKLHKEPDLTKKPPPPRKVQPDTPAQAQYKAIRTAKAGFMSAVAACTRPEKCDPGSPARDPEMVAMIKKMERQFVDVCESCATVEVCEEERTKIRAGTASFNRNPCFKKDPGADASKKETAKSDAPKKEAPKKDAPPKDAPKGEAVK